MELLLLDLERDTKCVNPASILITIQIPQVVFATMDVLRIITSGQVLLHTQKLIINKGVELYEKIMAYPRN